jgi:hypothetical protein
MTGANFQAATADQPIKIARAFMHLPLTSLGEGITDEIADGWSNYVDRDPENPCLAAALSYATERGWDIFPAPPGEKKSYKSAKHSNGAKWGKTRNPEQIRKDFRKWPDANIGIPTGKDNGFWVLEADTLKGHNVDGIASLRRLEEKHGPLPKTLMAESPSGSLHYYFNWPKGVEIKNSASSIAPGIDVKGEGGMVIAPPSVRDDGEYRWLNNHPIADAPQWLIDLVATKPKHNGKGAGPIEIAEAFRHLDPNQNLGQGIGLRQFSLLPLEPLMKECAFIRTAVETGGKNYTQPMWNLTTLCAVFLKNGHELAHRMGDKHPGYIEAKTDELWERKNREHKEKGVNWPSCEAIADSGCKSCAQCPHFLKKLSPLHLTMHESHGLFDRPDVPEHKLFQSSAEFVSDFVPPDYLIDGLLQRRYVYSFTAKTGDGKTTIALYLAACVAKGTTLAGCEVEKGRVLFFAGENPDDVRTRWIKLCEALGEDPDQMDVVFMPFTVDLSAETMRARIDAEAAKAGPFSLLIVDTSASYYSGNDENDNVALGNHARMLRSFVKLPGGPAILVTCHPIKNPDVENLLPRGGGAFLAEVDGNLVAIKDPNTMTIEVTTHGKFRGPDFAPFAFRLMPSTSPKLIDSKGRPVWSIYAEAISSAERETLKDAGYMEQDRVLRVMLEHPGCSLTEIAQHLGWLTGKREPNKQKVHRLMPKLLRAKLVKQRHDDRYILTPSGQEAAKEIPTDPKNG